MNKVKPVILAVLAVTLVITSMTASGQRRRSRPSPPTTRATAEADSRLTGLYQLDAMNSGDPRAAAARAMSNNPFGAEQRDIDALANRLASPDRLSIERRGRIIDIASSRAPRISFEADGRERVEQAADGHTVRTRAVLYGDQLMVSSIGSRDDAFTVTFDAIDNGRRLRVTRRINAEQFDQPVVVQSIYNKISSAARWNIQGEQRPAPVASTARNNPPPPPTNNRRGGPQSSPPVIRRPAPQPPRSEPARTSGADVLTIPNGTQLVAVLNNNISTAYSHEGDPFTLTVRAPAQFEGATIEGRVSQVNPAGRVAGRSEMTLSFERIRLRDGRTAEFAGYIESVRPVGGEEVRVDTEAGGNVQERDSQSNRAVQRAAIGAAVGAIIGAIAGGGKGAAIGAIAGAGAGAGSVYVQGRDHLELMSGTELAIRSRTPPQ